MKKEINETFKYEYGCVMAMLDDEATSRIRVINEKLIPDNILYHEKGEEYGRETESHVTIKFGLTNTYTEENMGKLISKIKPFVVTLTRISVFNNPKFDVVKFDVESNILKKLNDLFSKLPNEDEFPVYHPHLTLAYVTPGNGNKFEKLIKPITLGVNRIKYSTPTGQYFYDLK
jgi:2'-5' RNA ligase